MASLFRFFSAFASFRCPRNSEIRNVKKSILDAVGNVKTITNCMCVVFGDT